MLLGTVAALWRYPVKSLSGQSVPELAFDARGAVGDRTWAVYTADGGIGSGKTSRRFRRLEGLLSCASAGAPGESPVVTLPDGSSHLAGSAELDARLTAYVAQPVTVRPEGDVALFDDAPVHVLTTASLRAAGELQGTGPVDARHFRANVVIDVVGSDFAEDGWGGREVLLGGAVLRIGERMPRCVMVGLPQRDTAAEPRLLRALGGGHDATLGVMADVVRAGRVRTGDQATLLMPTPAGSP